MLRIFLKSIVLGGLLGAVISWACAITKDTMSPGEVPESYSLTPSVLTLDDAFVPWDHAEGQVTLQNSFTKVLSFSGFDGNCPTGIKWSPSSQTIQPGESSTLTFRFDPQHQAARASCELTPKLTMGGSAVPQKDHKTLTIWYEAGEAACELSAVNGHLDFGSVEAGASGNLTLTIKNTTTDPSRGMPFRYHFSGNSGDCGIFNYETWTDSIGALEPGGEKDIQFFFRPGAEGTFQCEKGLFTLQQGALLPNPCPSPVVFSGTGLPGPAPVCVLDPPDSDTLDYGPVQVGMAKVFPLTIRNETEAAIETNKFRYLFDNPVGDCALFPIDPEDMEGVIEHGGSKHIAVWFAPTVDGPFQCTRSLSSLKEPADETDPYIASPCPAEIVWKGSGFGAPLLQWSECSPGDAEDRHGLFGTPEGQVFAVGEGGSVMVSGGGCQWEPAGTGLSNITDVDLADIWAHGTGAEQVIWAVGTIPPPPGSFVGTGAVVRQQAGEWTVVDQGLLDAYSAVWGSGPNDVYFGGTGISTDFPNVKHWVGEGSDLETLIISDMGMSTVSGLSGTGSDDVWAVLRQGYYSVYRYQGSDWENQSQPFMTQPLNAVFSTQGADFYAVYVVGDNGAIYRYYGDGATPTWTDESIPGETRAFHGVWVSPTGLVLVVGEDMAAYAGHVDQPGQWAQVTPPEGISTDADLMDVWGTVNGPIYATGTVGVIIKMDPPEEY